MKPLKIKAKSVGMGHWDQIIQAVKTEEPVPAHCIIKIIRRADKKASFRLVDSEICEMARLKVIHRQWTENEEWAQQKEVFIYGD